MSDPSAVDDPFRLCGQTIEGKYRVASVIGDGGFGVVYRGVHKGFGELIAIKCLKMPPTLDAQQRDELLERLREEGRILHRLSRATSGIVQALDVGAFVTDAGVWVPYLVLEWLEGETLARFMRGRSERGEGGLPIADAIRLLDPAARALAVAHAQKVAHRDVKPANLFLSDVGGARTLKVLDFGIAKVLTDASLTEALAATVQGPSAFTPRYGAPEQFNKSRGATGPWTDVFALALIFVELVSGKRALEGDDPTQLYIASADPGIRPTLRSRGVTVGDVVERVIDRALAIEPKQRYASVGEFWDALVGAAAPEGPRNLPEAPTTAEASRRPAAPMDRTMPVESLDPEQAAPVRVKVAQGDPTRVEAAPLIAGAPPQQALRGAARVEDSMAETPSGLRPGGAKAPASKDPPAASDPSGAPAPPAARRRWPWLVAVAILAGGGAVAAYLLSAPPKRPRDRSGKATATAQGPAQKGRAAASASAATKPAGSVAIDAGAPDAMAAADALSAPPQAPEDMVYIPPVTATIGAGQDQREVTLSRGVFLDRHEVTVRAYEVCMAQQKCSAADHVSLVPEGVAPILQPSATDLAETWSRRCNAPSKSLDHPINCVDYANAESYCRFRGRRLPTEAEWEIAARGVEGRSYAWGAGTPSCERACYDRNGACRPRAAEVSTCPAGAHPGDRTAEGVYDLAANVAEWVSDGLVFPAPGGVDPRGDTAALLKVVRGASFVDDGDSLTATHRNGVAPVTAHATIGFRCAMDVPEPGGAQ